MFGFANRGVYDHAKTRWFERSRDSGYRTLDRIVEVLNSNVPDGWRLARFSGDFLVEDYLSKICLVGEMSRCDSTGRIYKNITTVLEHGMGTRDKKRKNYEDIKHNFGKDGENNAGRYPAAVSARPNLVIDWDSVWARQYERVPKNLNSRSMQYFRMHRIEKKGLLPEYKWLAWNATNKIDWVEEKDIPNNVHGEDYWQLPSAYSKKCSSCCWYIRP